MNNLAIFFFFFLVSVITINFNFLKWIWIVRLNLGTLTNQYILHFDEKTGIVWQQILIFFYWCRSAVFHAEASSVLSIGLFDLYAHDFQETNLRCFYSKKKEFSNESTPKLVCQVVYELGSQLLLEKQCLHVILQD